MKKYMNLITDYAFLCGYFSAERTLQPSDLEGWEPRLFDQQDRAILSNYYFPEFAQCMTDDIHMYVRPIEKDCVLDFGEEQIPFRLTRLQLWEAPFRIILFSVSIEFENQPFNSVTRALYTLRNCAWYGAVQQEFIQTALTPIMNIHHRISSHDPQLEVGPNDLSWLVESGNKFKLFQIIQAVDGIQEGDERLMLYDAGTLARHTPLSTGINSPEYIEHILSEHMISVFSGWSGLALLDTFTLLATDTPEQVFRNWTKDYFEKIYIYQLFRKVFLYSVNLRYRRRTEDVVVLEQRLDEFEQKYSYSAISYNFLPNIINAEMEKSLNTQRDYDQLNKMIGKEIEARRDKTEQKTNRFITFLTCLTIFSAIYDLASLLNDSFNYEALFHSGYIGFRLVGTILLLIIIIVYLLLAKKK